MRQNAQDINREERAAALADEILTLSRDRLLVHFRYLDRAIAGLPFSPNGDATFTTDGRRLYYNPWFVLSLYQGEDTVVSRDLLHSILHCVFRHNLIGRDVDRPAWDLACDVAVENAINALSCDCVKARRSERQSALIALLKNELPALTAERIYRYLLDHSIDKETLAAERAAFLGDSHGAWYHAGSAGGASAPDLDLEQLWSKISKRMHTERTLLLGKEDAMTQNLKSLHRARYNYTEFLRRFGVHGEVMRLSDEEFDNNYYTYGLSLYGNIPLIEPLEYQDEHRIRDLVIAIDTSGSVEGAVVQKFVQHTHDILARQERFSAKVNLYILQCDDRIQDAAYIQSKEDFDQYLAHMQIKGLGETDFRPVFAYVDELLLKKKLRNLRGLLYFTDGKGIFPAERPRYDTAFILHNDGFSDVWTPDWAMKLYLSEDEILDERFGK